MAKLGKLDFKIKFISNESEEYTSFNINNNLIFFDRFQFLSSSLDSLLKIGVNMVLSICAKDLTVS